MNAPHSFPPLAEPTGDVLHGVLPWRMARRPGLRIFLVDTGDGAWTVPAGAPVAGRAAFLSAALHAFEEAGVIGDIDTVPLGDYRRGAARLRLFAMEVRGTLSHWKRRGGRQRRWFSPPEAAGLVRDPALAAAIHAFAAAMELPAARAETGEPGPAASPQPPSA